MLKKILVTLMLLTTILSAGIRVDRYVDEFGDRSGAKYVQIWGQVIGSYNHVGAIYVNTDGTVEFRTSKYLTTSSSSQTIKFRDNTGKTLTFTVYTSDLGSNLQTFPFDLDQSNKVIAMFKKATWVKIVAWRFDNTPIVSKIYATGFTAALKNNLGL